MRNLDIKFLSCIFSKNRQLDKLYCTFLHIKKLEWLFLMKEVKISPDRKVIKFLTFDNLFPPLLNDIRVVE